MSPDKIKELLAIGESQRVEFKANALDLESLGRIICGFLNTAGGYLICGALENGRTADITLTGDAIAELERTLHTQISPKAFVSVQVQELQGKQVMVIEVPAGKDIPYAFRDIIYIRTDDNTIKADAATIRDIVLRHQIEPVRWERRFSLADIDSDLDPKELQDTVADAQKARRAFFRDTSRPIMVLEDLSAAQYGRLTNGGDILFTRNPARRFPQTQIRATRYDSDKTGDTYSDMKAFEGPLHVIFEEAYSFIIRNTPTVSRFIKGSAKRIDSPLYPEDAVREALINALAHRDYSSTAGGVSIHIFPTRLEIWNSGALPEGITAEHLATGHISVLRNPDIAHVLYLRGLMEKAGRGTVLMYKQCEANNLPAPVWQSDPALGVRVTFQTGEVTEEVTEEVMRVLHVMTDSMKRSEIQDQLGLKHEEHFRRAYLLPAMEAGLIEMTIPDKPRSRLQQYRLTGKGLQFLKQTEKS